MDLFSSVVRWFSGGVDQYHTLYHCMRGDTFWVAITVLLDVTVAIGYGVIAMHWWKNQMRVPATPARTALGNIRNIFVLCGICGYLFIPIKMFWPAWRLYDLVMGLLVYFTWRYAVQAKDLKVVYNELGRSGELTRELEKSRDESRRKSFFLNSLSHDLRTPLNGLVLQTQVARMSMDGGDQESLRKSLEDIESNARATGELLDGLLQCARLDWSEEPNSISQFDLTGLLEQIVSPLRTMAEQKGIQLNNTCPANAFVQTDRLKLERIINNLLSNAVKFTERGGVKLVAECASGALEIHVIDTGIGLSPEHQARLFEEFYQVQNHARDRKKGFGLGLSIARRLARQLGGDIEVESAAGRGSRFSVLLPGVVVDAATQRANNSASAPSGSALSAEG